MIPPFQELISYHPQTILTALAKNTTSPDSHVAWENNSQSHAKLPPMEWAQQSARHPFSKQLLGAYCALGRKKKMSFRYKITKNSAQGVARESHLFIESAIHVCTIDRGVESKIFPVFPFKLFKLTIAWGTVPVKRKRSVNHLEGTKFLNSTKQSPIPETARYFKQICHNFDLRGFKTVPPSVSLPPALGPRKVMTWR